MGFLKFLKREKKQVATELDLPPAPPPLPGFEDEMPKLPDFPDFSNEKMPESPDQSHDLSFPDMGNLPDFPSFPEFQEQSSPAEQLSQPFEPSPILETNMEEPQNPIMPQQAQIPQDTEAYAPADYEKLGKRLFTRERQGIRERTEGKTVYVRVDRFKATLGNINTVRNDLKKSEEAISKLESIKFAREKSFERVKASLDDLQKKLIFIDKTIFKGE